MSGQKSPILAALLVAGLVAACSGDDSTEDGGDTIAETSAAEEPPAEPPEDTVVEATTTEAPGPEMADDELVEAVEADLAAGVEGCDPIDTRQCLLPFPSDAYAVTDTATVTGLRVAIPEGGFPTNVDGVTVDPIEWNRNDGFSPSSTILVHLPGLDVDASVPVTWTDLGAWMADDASIVLVNAATGERVPLWAEADGVSSTAAEALLVIQPAINLESATTYVVGIRQMVGADGELLEPNATFTAYRDGLVTELDAVEERRASMEGVFDVLEGAGVVRDELQLAWRFTTASTESITGRMLHMRDESLDRLGDAAPPFEITTVVEEPGEGIARSVGGTFITDNWLTGDGSPGNGFDLDDQGLPTLNGTIEVEFQCNIGDTSMASSEPSAMALYGHGLLGSYDQIDGSYVMDFGNEHDIVFCATKWAGFSDDDVGTAALALGDITNFPLIADRIQQGVLHQMVLSRLMLAGDGLVTHPAFLRPDGTTVLDNTVLHYDGNSQGGIFGTMLAGVSTDIERFVLGVPGINYSVLLWRSVDFEPFLPVMEAAYPSALDRNLLISAIQMLWDRGEGSGYVRHIVDDPLPGTPVKEVLLHVAFGDWQVTELAAYNQARTMGIPIHRPVAAEGRSHEVEPGWGLDTLDYATDASALLVWDSQSAPIPVPRTPPFETRDPHGDPRKDVDVRIQKAAFLLDGELVDVCGDAPCFADPN